MWTTYSGKLIHNRENNIVAWTMPHIADTKSVSEMLQGLEIALVPQCPPHQPESI